MKSTAVAWSIAVTLVAGTLPWAHADGSAPAAKSPEASHLTLQIDHASKADAAKRLGEALGGEVRFEGTTPETLSVSLTDATLPAALKKVASVVGGTLDRVLRFSKSDAPKAGDPVISGINLALRLKDTPCDLAAKMVARMANARLENEGEITGTVSLGGEEMPMEEALDKIAKAAGMQWRFIYIFRVAAAETPKTEPTATKPKANRPDPTAAQVEDPHQFSTSNGRVRKPATGRPPRTKYNTVGPLGAKAPPQKPPRDLKKAEEMARLGVFQGIFSFDDKDERTKHVKQMRSALETQARRLDTFEPRYRITALQMQVMQLQQFVLDYGELNDDQKKEVEPVMDFVNDRIKEAETITQEHH